MKFGISPWNMGLLNMGQGFFAGMGHYFDQQRVLDNRLQAYKYRYDRMGDVAMQREKFNERMALLRATQGGKPEVSYTQGPGGDIIRRETQKFFNPDSGQMETKVNSEIPLKDFVAAQSKRGSTVNHWYDTGPDGKVMEYTKDDQGNVHVAPRWKAPAPPQARDVTSTSQASELSSFMRGYANADPGKKLAMLQEAGIDTDKVSDPKQRRDLLEQAEMQRLQARANSFNKGGAAAGGGAQSQQGSQGGMYDNLEKGPDGNWRDKTTGQPVYLNKKDGSLVTPAVDSSGKPIPNAFQRYTPPAATGTPTASTDTGDTGDTGPQPTGGQSIASSGQPQGLLEEDEPAGNPMAAFNDEEAEGNPEEQSDEQEEDNERNVPYFS